MKTTIHKGTERYMKKNVIYLLLTALPFFVSAQVSYNACNSALEICAQTTFNINNIGANVTFCPNCEDDFNFCFIPRKTIWLKFITNNSGGDVQLDFTNLVFEMNAGQDNELQATLIQANIPCNSTSYTQIGNCVSNSGANFSLNAIGLLPNTTYYVVIGGDLTGAGITSAAECTFDIYLSGVGVDRPFTDIQITGPAAVCENQMATFLVYVLNCPDSIPYKWYVNGNLAAITTENFFQTSSLQFGDVVSVETNCYTQCPIAKVATTVPLNVISLLLDAGADQSIEVGESVILNGQTTAINYNWTPSFGLSNDTILNPIASPDVTTTYTLTAVKNGCTFVDYVTVTLSNYLLFPNTFSPNNDGENDVWEIVGVEKFPDCQVTIYDRWGQVVYEATGYNKEKAWSGKRKSGEIDESVYFYEVKLRDSQKQVFKGSITLIR